MGTSDTTSPQSASADHTGPDHIGPDHAGSDHTDSADVVGAVVVGVDGSTESRRAVEWAADHAALERRPLVLLHAAPVTGPVSGLWLDQAGIDHVQLREAIRVEARAHLLAAEIRVQERHPDLPVHTRLVDGDPRSVLHSVGATAALLVVGSRGRGPVASLLLGSVSAAVARHAPCPVVVVRDAVVARPGGVVVGVDATPASRAAVEFAFREASLTGRRLIAVHCLFDIEHAEMGHAFFEPRVGDIEEARLLVSETMAGIVEKFPDVEVECRYARGPADEMLVRAAAGMDLVVVGAERRGPIGTALFGSVAGSVLEHAHGSVAVVPLGRR